MFGMGTVGETRRTPRVLIQFLCMVMTFALVSCGQMERYLVKERGGSRSHSDLAVSHGGQERLILSNGKQSVHLGPLSALTRQLLNAKEEHGQAATSDAREKALTRLLSVVEARKVAMLAALEEEPETVVRVALSQRMRDQYPLQVVGFLEQPTRLSGELSVIYSTPVDRAGISQRHFRLTSLGGKVHQLHISDGTQLRNGQVEVQGYLLDTHVAVETISVSPVVSTPNALTMPSQQKVAVVLFNFQDAPTSEPKTAEQIRQEVFTGTYSTDD